jgi:NAD-dependent dihydropyrimidine dehydrogenase PreA subunit
MIMAQATAKGGISDINLGDPTTEALYNFYGENEKGDFETSYLYMRYLYEFVSMLLQGFGTPLIPEVAELGPDVIEKLNAKRDVIMAGFGSNDASVYHSKVIQLKNAEQLVTIEVDVNLEVPETVVPFKLARNVILNHPESIAIGTCPCRFTNPECTCMPEPMEACMFIGDPHASFVAEHNPRFRKITPQMAIDILEDCHKRGFVQCAYFKKDMGNRLYAICNCCSCCCGSLKVTNMFHDGIFPTNSLAPSGYVAQVGDECNGCGECVEKCQFHAIRLNEDQSRAEVVFENCMGCGVCEGVCPMGIVTTRLEPSKGGVFDLEELQKLGV